MRPPRSLHHKKSPRETTPIQEAFLSALKRRCQDGGQVTLPTGEADADEVAQVLAALDRVRQC